MLNLRRADCLHWIAAEAPPVGYHEGAGHSPLPVYLCPECLALAQRSAPPAGEPRSAQPVLEAKLPPPAERPEPAPPPEPAAPPAPAAIRNQPRRRT